MAPVTPGKDFRNEDDFDDGGPLNDGDLVQAQDYDDQQNAEFDDEEDAEKLQAEENVLNNHLECVK